MAVVRSRDAIRVIILDGDKGAEKPTRFLYKLPTQKFMDKIETESARYAGNAEKLIPIAKEIIREHIVGWEDLIDEEGKEVPFIPVPNDPRKRMSDQSFEAIIDFKQELLEKLMAAIQMKPRDLEQSPSPT